jgi:hypothetical protein
MMSVRPVAAAYAIRTIYDSEFSNLRDVELVLPDVLVVAAAVPVEGRPRRLDPAVRVPGVSGVVEDGGVNPGVAGAGGVNPGVAAGAGGVKPGVGANAGATTGGIDMRGIAFDEDDPARTSPGGSGLVCDWAIVKLTINKHAVPIDMRYFLSVMGVVLFLK